jgi:methionyl-tRNA formyltransferase
MRLDAGLDTGDVLLARGVPVGPDATSSELFVQLADVGAELILETLRGLEKGSLQARPQDHNQATLAPILTREDGLVLLNRRTAKQAYDRWRGFYPWPGAYGHFRGKRFLVHRMHMAPDTSELAPGELRLMGEDLLAGAANGTVLVFDEVQLEGKPRLAGAAFARGFQLKSGERLG